MKASFQSLIVIVALVVPLAVAKPVHLHFDVGNPPLSSINSFLEKRGNTAIPISNSNMYYMAELILGSDNQVTRLVIDTGSSDIWVMASDVVCICLDCYANSKRDRTFYPGNIIHMYNNEERGSVHGLINDQNKIHTQIKKTNPINKRFLFDSTVSSWTTTATCTLYGSFNTGSSDSFQTNSSAPKFLINYADGSEAWGVWGRDTVSIGDINIGDMSFAIGQHSTSEIGVCGIGLPGLQSTAAKGYEYLNLPAKMLADGIIQKNAYSIFLNSSKGTQGSVLFGGVDRSKYKGDLVTLPMVNTYFTGKQVRSTIALKDITLAVGGKKVKVTDGSYGVLLDTGATYTYVSESVFHSIGKSLMGKYDSSLNAYLVNCPGKDAGTINFDFNGITIDIPLGDLTTSFAEDICMLTIFPKMGSNYFTLGNNFLRYTYVVFDLEDLEISLAKANYGGNPDIVEISRYIPGAAKAVGYLSTSIASSFGTGTIVQTLKYATASGSIASSEISGGSTRSSSSTSNSMLSTSTSVSAKVLSLSTADAGNGAGLQGILGLLFGVLLNIFV